MNQSIIFFLLILLFSCQNNNQLTNQFTKSDDTLMIKTKKYKGNGLFQLGAGRLVFKDTSEKFSHKIKFPKEINDVKRLKLKVDFKEKKEFYVELIKGKKNGKQVFIVDENNNKDFTDDLIREYKKINWEPSTNLVKCKYYISNGEQIVQDSSWLNIGKSNGYFLLGKSEHLRAKFNIENEEYEIGIIEQRNPLSFTYGFQSEITFFNNLGKQKDSISERDLIKLGEVLNLNGKFFRFEKISNNGSLITLVKDKNIETLIGTQIGMIAPDFKVITTSNDTIKSSDLFKKLTIIANSCGCGGDKQSTEAFYEMEKNFGNTINILHVDSNIKKDDIGIHIDSEKKYNRHFYENYRKEYCSRLCYAIGKNRRIVDKFNINEWKSALPKIIE